MKLIKGEERVIADAFPCASAYTIAGCRETFSGSRMTAKCFMGGNVLTPEEAYSHSKGLPAAYDTVLGAVLAYGANSRQAVLATNGGSAWDIPARSLYLVGTRSDVREALRIAQVAPEVIIEAKVLVAVFHRLRVFGATKFVVRIRCDYQLVGRPQAYGNGFREFDVTQRFGLSGRTLKLVHPADFHDAVTECMDKIYRSE